MHQLSDIDSSLVYLETPASPLHSGGLYLFAEEPGDASLTLDSLSRLLESNLHRAPFFRQRLVETPIHIDRPYWADDPDFSIDRHLDYQQLTNPDRQSLLNLAAEILATPLDRDRPLWHITYVGQLETATDLEGSRFALIIRLHQAARCDTEGHDILSLLLSFVKTEHHPPPEHWEAEPMPSRARLLTASWSDAIQAPFRLASRARDAAASGVHQLVIEAMARMGLPEGFFEVPRTRFNRRISKRRSLAWADLPIETLKAIKSRCPDSVTLNDLILTLCAEAVRDFLTEAESLPERSLVALAPISVRSTTLDEPSGTRMSGMLLPLATKQQSVVNRLLTIGQHAMLSEHYSEAIDAESLQRIFPSTLATLSARLYTTFQLAQHHSIIFNLPIVNIPGPNAPLYLGNARLIRQMESIPLVDGIGLTLCAVSYRDTVTITATTCPDLIPSARAICDALPKALSLMEQALTKDAFPENPVTAQLEDKPSGSIDVLIGILREAMFRHLLPGKQPSEDDSEARKSG